MFLLGLGFLKNRPAICGFHQVDIWLHDDNKSLFVLGVSEPSREVVENAAVFSFEELLQGLQDDEPCVVVGKQKIRVPLLKRTKR